MIWTVNLYILFPGTYLPIIDDIVMRLFNLYDEGSDPIQAL